MCTFEPDIENKSHTKIGLFLYNFFEPQCKLKAEWEDHTVIHRNSD